MPVGVHVLDKKQSVKFSGEVLPNNLHRQYWCAQLLRYPSSEEQPGFPAWVVIVCANHEAASQECGGGGGSLHKSTSV